MATAVPVSGGTEIAAAHTAMSGVPAPTGNHGVRPGEARRLARFGPWGRGSVTGKVACAGSRATHPSRRAQALRFVAGPGGGAASPGPPSAGDRSRSPDPGLSWALAVAVGLTPHPWRRVDQRGSRKRRKTPCPCWWHRQSAGEQCSPARSGRSGNQRMGSRARSVLADKGGSGGKRRSLVPRDGATPDHPGTEGLSVPGHPLPPCRPSRHGVPAHDGQDDR